MQSPSPRERTDAQSGGRSCPGSNPIRNSARIYIQRKLGWTLGKDLVLIQTGGLPETRASLHTGRIQAGILSPPTTLEARRLGLKELYNMSVDRIPFPGNVITVGRRIVREQPDLVRRVVKAFTEGIHKAKTDKAFTERVSARYARATNQDVLDETCLVFDRSIADAPYVKVEGVETVFREPARKNHAALKAKAADFVDNRFVVKPDRSGYIDSLYGRRYP